MHGAGEPLWLECTLQNSVSMSVMWLSVCALLGAASVPAAASDQDEESEAEELDAAREAPSHQAAVSSGQEREALPATTRRNGWTLEAGLGIGYVDLPDTNYGQGGLYGLNLGVGRFVSPDLAITVRGTGVYTLRTDGAMTMASALVSVQFFVTDRITVGGGVGAVFADIAVGSTRVSRDPGFAGNARLGVGLAEWESGIVRAVLEMNTGRIGTTRLVNDGIGLECQFY
jgi:hypothetical protein